MPARVLARLTRGLAAGDILLLHDGHAQRARAPSRWCWRCCRALLARCRSARPAHRHAARRGAATRRRRTAMKLNDLGIAAVPITASRNGVRPAQAWRQSCSALPARAYRRCGRFAWHFARGKLGRDPVFRGTARPRRLSRRGRACSTSAAARRLLASLLRRVRRRWSAATAGPPLGRAAHRRALHRHRADAARRGARRAGAGRPAVARRASSAATCAQAVSPPCDVVVILDVLHYVDHAAQDDVLRARARRRCAPGGRAAAARGRRGAAARLCDQPVGRPRRDAGARPPRAAHLGPPAGRLGDALQAPGLRGAHACR